MEWQPISTYPKSGPVMRVRVKMKDGTIHEDAHWASDLSGEEQPPFEGWFIPAGQIFHCINTPEFWMPSK